MGSRRGRELTCKVTGEDTNGALDFFTAKVAPKNGPPLHVHHTRDEAIYVLRGRFKVVVGDETYSCDEGGFAFMPASLPHAFINLTDDEEEIIVTYTPGGSQVFYEEIGRTVRKGAGGETEASIFAKHDMTVLGPPLSAD